MAPHRIFTASATPGLSRRMSERARAPQPGLPGAAAAVEGMRQAMRDLLDRMGEVDAALAAGATTPRRPRCEMLAGPEGWRLRVELPGVAPEEVAVAQARGALLVSAAGRHAYAARIPLPAEAEPKSLRWHCAHGLLEALLAPRGTRPEEDTP
ncbi:Hsp20/alpha crystallin family protein [Roseomonas sp. GC11]|uniref:Hsp20/alpha crystallin family protein n=1 Tax=Roseomonas sp. GC11 TaxID=2950546 RepID=UPI002108AE36|nr:Hsp20/alpha crystallin family protein [Roseomonas sp. GC11]MCQ4161674.1 Hsp20/alpha crystallin family protein [Roseomonas sp. GC11]